MEKNTEMRASSVTIKRNEAMYYSPCTMRYPKNVHTKLDIIVLQVSPDSERAFSHRRNKPDFIKISLASQRLGHFKCSEVNTQV